MLLYSLPLLVCHRKCQRVFALWHFFIVYHVEGEMKKIIAKYEYTLLACFVIIACVVYYVLDPAQYIWMPKCPVKILTSLNCPSCGFQRALHTTLQGDFLRGISYNPFLLVAIPIVCLWIIISIVVDHTTDTHRKGALIHLNMWLIYIYIACYICWFVVRNILGI